MSLRKKISIDDIQGKLVEHFQGAGLTIELLFDFKRRKYPCLLARRIYIYLANSAGYSNQDTAKGLGYKDAKSVSAELVKAFSHIQKRSDEDDQNFIRVARAVAKLLGSPSLVPNS